MVKSALLNRYRKNKMNTHQVRRLPKKSVIAISVIIVIAFAIFYVIQDLKEKKLTPVILSEFFNIKYKTNEGDISNMKLEKSLLLESIQYCPEIYNKLHEYDKLKDLVV